LDEKVIFRAFAFNILLECKLIKEYKMLKPKKKLGTHKEIKQDKLVTYYFQALDVLEKHKKLFIYGLITIVAIVAISAYSRTVSFNKEQEASVELAKGKSAFENARYQEATQVLGPLTSKYSGTQSAGFGVILLAKSFFALEKYDEAEQYFRTYLDDYSDDKILNITARTGIASCYDQKGEYDKAARAYEDAANSYTESFKAPELLFSAARCFSLANDKANAKRVLERLTSKYPDSQTATSAKQLLAELSF
jgi:predicted negative regulator of RcsB-dependent stress response